MKQSYYLGNIVFLDKNDIEKYNIENNIIKLLNFTEHPPIKKNIPTLFVGFEKIKEIFTQINILEHKIDNNFYWTFSPNEDRFRFLEGLNDFLDNFYNILVNDINIKIIDNIFYKNILNEEKILPPNINYIDVYYENNNSLYLYVKCYKIVYIIDLNYYNFIGFDINNIKDNIKKISNLIHEDDDNKIKSFFINHFKNNEEGIEKYIPFLLNFKN